jgi:hypothetical protein
VVDIAAPRGDGLFVVAAAGRLFFWSPAGGLRPFARGRGGYVTAAGPEPYITIAGNGRVAGTGCALTASTGSGMDVLRGVGAASPVAVHGSPGGLTA